MKNDNNDNNHSSRTIISDAITAILLGINKDNKQAHI